jgi:hypothetical protein
MLIFEGSNVDTASTRVTRLDKILPFGLLFKGSRDFLVANSSPKSGTGNNFGYFCPKASFYIFTLISSFKAWFVGGILSFFFYVLDFQIEP